MLDIEVRVLIGWYSLASQSEHVPTRFFMLRWPTFRTASLFIYIYQDYFSMVSRYIAIYLKHICISGISQVYCSYAADKLQVCFRYITGILQVYFRYITGILQVCFRYITGMFQVYFRYITGILQVCFRYISGILQVCFRYITGILQAYCSYAADMLHDAVKVKHKRIYYYCCW